MKRSLSATVALTITLITLIVTPYSIPAQQQQPSQPSSDDLKKQLGTIVVAPGSGPALAVADFQPRAGGVNAAVATFNDVLWNDLKFASVASLVGKSLYPKTRVADPASLQYPEWADEPTKADYVAFGNLTSAGEAQGFLFDVKTRQQLLASRLTGDTRRMAHEFADQIVKLLTGADGIATSKIAFIKGHEVYLMDYDGYGERQFSRDGSIAL